MFYGSSLEGKEAASEKTYRDHDDGWFEFSWVVLKSLRLTKSLQVLYTPRAFVYLCYVGQVKLESGDAYLL